MPAPVRWAVVAAAGCIVAYTVWVLVHPTGFYSVPVDGWGVDVLELALCALCVARFFEPTWRASTAVTRAVPVVLGVACLSWAVGDVLTTIQSFGGASAPVPSASDVFYFAFYPVAFVCFAMLIRRGNGGAFLATSLDGVIAGLAVAALSAALAERAAHFTHTSALAAGTILAYPLGDVLLLVLAIGGLTILPRGFRPFFSVVCVAFVIADIGDTFNLLQPGSTAGALANAVAWPIAIALFTLAAWLLPANVKSSGAEWFAGFGLPTFGALVSVGIFLTASFGHVSKPALVLATFTIVVAGLRLARAVGEAHALRTARFRSLIDKTWDLIVVTEADLRIAYMTPSSERVFGRRPTELENEPFTHIVHPDDSHVVLDHVLDLKGDADEAATFEVRMQHASGEWRTIAWTASNLLADPSVNGYVLNGFDVTEARQASEDLLAARDAALVASKTKSEFVSMMSHEIRTPMNGVIGLTELLLETDLDHDQQELASGVKVSADRLLVIINDILDFSKIEAGKLEIEEVSFDVRRVVDDVGRILAGAAHAKGIELLVDVDPSVPSALLGDETRIQQVLLNFGSNGVKFTAEGEVVIRLSVLHENTARVALHFEVTDTGIGIADGDEERLFSPFAQADTSTTRRFGGTGLGLTICRQLVELMGGRIGLTSTPGAGSTFWFELSLRRSDDAPAGEKPGAPRTLSGQRALVVDDNATNRRILRQQLTSWGVEAVEATNGHEALELAVTAGRNATVFDLAIIDLNMPGMDGMELAQALKADPATQGTVLFLLSSSGQRLEAAESHLLGFAATMTKPVRASELFDCLITSLHSGDERHRAVVSKQATHSDTEVLGMILLVEDNHVNQMVGSKVLQKLGYSFAIANNGVEALDAFRSGPGTYDAVLMDCQMPEMDGYQATMAIRELEGTARHTPIIAMTAAAMEGDREACMAAGMDDFISKPVRLEAVAEVLARWITRSESDEDPGAEAATDAGEGAPGNDPLDRSQIDLLLDLDDGEGRALIEIAEEYIAHSKRVWVELRRTLSAGDVATLERSAHTLKGASANVGASTLAQLCGALESHARMEQLDEVSGLMDQCDAEFARVQDALEVLTASAAT
jgi:two-component system, sensor histidine kinase and response regulator